ncbi:MAG: ATP-dependent DNA helicase UvrD2 [Microthrixaceae bacterium]|nr:ATP-dependent DNA helicase UvrD2 [Microthrixaceae bacterium]
MSESSSEPDALVAGLNPEQREAATHDARHLRILAGAGSGKTRVLTRRIAYQAATGAIDPRAVLAVTFTRKAASELRSRLGQLGLRDGVQAGTFHSIAWAQLRQRWAERSITPPELVTSKLGMIRSVSGDRSKTALLDVMSEIEWANARCVEPDDYPAAAVAARRDPPHDAEKMARIMADYVNYKRRQRVVDFDDLLRLAARDLKADPVYASGRQWMNRFLFVDEFQDVNPRQFQLLSAWMGEGAQLTVVGDPHQAIYAWNGADAGYLVDFPRYFADAATVTLTRNYRSTPQIITVANAVLRDGSDQRGASLVPTRPDGPVPTVAVHPDEVQEARQIARELRSARRPGRRWADLAVLVRTNAQLAPLTRALGAADIPHRTRGGGGLLEQAEVADALRSLRRAREVGTWVGDLARELREVRPQVLRSEDLLDEDANPDDVPESEDGVEPTEPSSETVRDDATPRRPRGTGRIAPEHLTADRLANLDELVRLGREYLDLDPGGTPTGFTAWLRSSLADAGGADTDAVELSTFHAAKGLEWPVVHLAGVEKGLIPIHFAETQADLAEETRLFYVAITRAEEELVFHRAEKRTAGTREMRRKPSEFLEPVEAAMDFLNGVEHRRPRTDRPKRGRRSTPATKAGLTGADAELFAKLRAWRLDQSKAAKKPAFVILTDDVLTQLASERPATRAELLGTRGIGPTKADLFGDALLELIAAAD